MMLGDFLGGGAASPSREEFAARLTRYYSKYKAEKLEDLDATVRERAKAWEAAFARAEAAEAREKAKAAGAPVVAASVDADVAADRETRLEELRKRARETVRLASQGEEF